MDSYSNTHLENNDKIENDEEVGLGDVDERIKNQEPQPEEQHETDKTRDFFLKLAGEDMEVDWRELKEILDYAMKTELPANKESIGGGGAPDGGGSIINSLLSMVCGAACKDTPLADAFAPSNETKYGGFSKDVCRSMVAMMDTDYSGKLGFEEFKTLWTDIRNWKAVFKLYDKDNTNQLNAFELREALNSAGYKLNNHILNVLVHRYGTKEGYITFDDFIMCAVRLKTMIDLFRDKDPNNSDTATFSLEEWLQKTVYS